ncbi:MAG TPA: ABC transporter permease [Solirubrobacter sp.]|nr:ABC transporter permease [Solirubrobacter sp.]
MRRLRNVQIDPVTTIAWLAGTLLFFVAWEVIGQSGRYYSIPPMTDTVSTLWDAIVSGDLIGPTAATVSIAAIGFVISVVAGILLGLAIGSSKLVADVLEPMLNAAYGAPIVVFIPVITLYMGSEVRGKVALVVLFCIFAIVMNTAAGVRNVEPGLREMGRAFGVTGLRYYWGIVLAGALPQIFTGVRIASGRAIQGVLLGELLLRVDNLGFFMVDASSRFNIPRLVAGTFFVALLAFALMAVVRLIENRILRWKLPAG